jgi:homoserine kinase type II
MAVYTVLEETQIQALTAPYALGELARVQGVGEGVENTNYFLSFQDPAGERRTGDDYLLTIFEHITAGELEFYLQWL